jgi:uncharacterized damage-inducible protein DinB
MNMDNKLQMTRGVLEITPRRWLSLVDTLPEELLQRPSSPGEWSAADCLSHLLDTERNLLAVRLQHILEGRAELIPFDPDAPRERGPERSPQEMLAAFLALRGDTNRILDGLSNEDLNRSSFHPEYGVEVTLGELLDLWAAHDLLHTVQAEKALMQAFIPGTSVWRPEFADHDLEMRGVNLAKSPD